MRKIRRGVTAIVVMAGLGLAACSGVEVSERPERLRGGSVDSSRERTVEGSLSELFGGELGNAQLGAGRAGLAGGNVNKHLWAASLDTLSFLPLASTDPFTGVIATDWSVAPERPDERLKVTAYVTDIVLSADALQVAVFRERLNENGAWVAAPVDAETPRRLEDAILTKARLLRREELAGAS